MQISGLKSTLVSERDEFKKKIEIEKNKAEGLGPDSRTGLGLRQMSLRTAEKTLLEEDEEDEDIGKTDDEDPENDDCGVGSVDSASDQSSSSEHDSDCIDLDDPNDEVQILSSRPNIPTEPRIPAEPREPRPTVTVLPTRTDETEDNANESDCSSRADQIISVPDQPIFSFDQSSRHGSQADMTSTHLCLPGDQKEHKKSKISFQVHKKGKSHSVSHFSPMLGRLSVVAGMTKDHSKDRLSKASGPGSGISGRKSPNPLKFKNAVQNIPNLRKSAIVTGTKTGHSVETSTSNLMERKTTFLGMMQQARQQVQEEELQLRKDQRKKEKIGKLEKIEKSEKSSERVSLIDNRADGKFGSNHGGSE